MTLSIDQRCEWLPRLRCRSIIGLLLILPLAVLLSGCGAVKLGYNNSPMLSYWWLDDYLDFDQAQTVKVRADLVTLQTWHRSRELPAYVETLEKLQRMAPANVSSAQVCEVLSDVKPRIQAFLDEAEPSIAALVPTLDPTQIERLAQQLNKRSDTWREEWLAGTLGERQARRLKQATERLERFYGRLEAAQLAVLRANIVNSVFDANVNFKESKRRHQDTLQTLRQLQGSTDAQQTRNVVHALLARTMNSPDAVYLQQFDLLTQENCKSFAALHNSTTATQRLKAMETLKGYTTDARTLIAQQR
jgi:hypothetical protein